MAASLQQFLSRIRALLRPGELDRDFDEELESHLAMAVEDYVARGMSDEQALRKARLDLGEHGQLLEAHRAMRGLPLIHAILRDLRYGLGVLRRNPEFALTASLISLLCLRRHGRQHMRAAVILLCAAALARYIRRNAQASIDHIERPSES